MIDIEKGKLQDYEWSSYPAYIRKHKPEWLHRVWGRSASGYKENTAGRLTYRRKFDRLVVEAMGKLTLDESDLKTMAKGAEEKIAITFLECHSI